MEIREENIINQVKEWTYTYISPDFKFRKYQLEAIVMVIKNVLFNSKIQVMEAPTGSGKSFIGIISAGVLWEYYKKKSYILASDLSLYRQYEDAIKKYKLPWGMLKGQDNYICGRNGHIISSSHCKIAMAPVSDLATPSKCAKIGYACAGSCPYIQDLVQAARAPVTLLTYALYFIRVQSENESPMFPLKEGCPNLNLVARDFVVCDEAHNLPSLVQNQFSPVVDTENLQFVELLNTFAEDSGDVIPTVDSVKETIQYMVKFEQQDQVKVCAERLESQFAALDSFSTEVVRETVKNWPSEKKKEGMKYITAANTCRDIHECFKVFNSLVRGYSDKVIVKSNNKTGTGVRLNCAYEDKLIYEYFHKVAHNELLMSATIGDVDIYRQLIGANNYEDDDFKPIEIKSTFDFSQSPIYYDTRYRMSYREKANSMPKVIKEAIDICDKNKDKRGIIHTGSYEVTEAFFKALTPSIRYRVIKYTNSKDKGLAIKRFLDSRDGILVGPSLLEGLDFAGDGCRFNIFMKMPYASLADNLVKAKMNLFPDWYSLDVCSRLEQGIGRGVRYNSDWCNTYILDGCFSDILNQQSRTKNLCESTVSRLVKIE